MPRLALLLFAATLLPLAACDTEVDRSVEADAASVADTGTRPGAAPESPGRDLTGIDLCDLVPAEDVAEITGGVSMGMARTQDLGTAQRCTYGVGAGVTGGSAEGLSIGVRPPAMFEDSEDVAEAARAVGDPIEIRPVTGLGAASFLAANVEEGVYTVHVLREHDLALQATADRPEQAIALAQLAIQRLGPLPDTDEPGFPPTS